ncbi:MAG: phytanoyl-CoA dioxygenase family protein [Cyanobacteria bacterium P01_F01_bin.150]
MIKLTQEQIKKFHQKGWIGPLDLFSMQEVEPIHEQLKKVSRVAQFRDITQPGEQAFRIFHNQYFKAETHINHHFWCQSLYNLLLDSRIVDYLNILGEKDLLLWRSGVFNRMPQQVGVGWHQAVESYRSSMSDEETVDLIFPEDTEILNFTVWIALNDITEEMGNLQFANGSHRKRFKVVQAPLGKGAYPEERYRDMQEQLPEQSYSRAFVFDENDWEVESILSIKAGQIIIFNEHCMHQVPGNYGDRERWGINGRYIPPSVQIHPQRLTNNHSYDEYNCDLKKHYSILVSGRDDYGLNRVENINHQMDLIHQSGN